MTQSSDGSDAFSGPRSRRAGKAWVKRHSRTLGHESERFASVVDSNTPANRLVLGAGCAARCAHSGNSTATAEGAGCFSRRKPAACIRSERLAARPGNATAPESLKCCHLQTYHEVGVAGRFIGDRPDRLSMDSLNGLVPVSRRPQLVAHDARNRSQAAHMCLLGDPRCRPRDKSDLVAFAHDCRSSARGCNVERENIEWRMRLYFPRSNVEAKHLTQRPFARKRP